MPRETTPTSETAGALPSFTVGGIEYEPAKFSPLGTVALKASDLAALLSALPDERQSALLLSLPCTSLAGKLYAKAARCTAAEARATTAETALAEKEAELAGVKSDRDGWKVVVEKQALDDGREIVALRIELAAVKGERDELLGASRYMLEGFRKWTIPDAIIGLDRAVRHATPPAVETTDATGGRVADAWNTKGPVYLAESDSYLDEKGGIREAPHRIGERVTTAETIGQAFARGEAAFGPPVPEVVGAKCPECAPGIHVAVNVTRGSGVTDEEWAASEAMAHQLAALLNTMPGRKANVERNGTEAAEKKANRGASALEPVPVGAGEPPGREADAGDREQLAADGALPAERDRGVQEVRAPVTPPSAPVGRSEDEEWPEPPPSIDVCAVHLTVSYRGECIACRGDRHLHRYDLAAGSASVQGPADVERVAAAIYEAKYQKLRYADLQDEKRDDFRRYARAAIAAGSASSVSRERVRECINKASTTLEKRPARSPYVVLEGLLIELRRLCDGE